MKSSVKWLGLLGMLWFVFVGALGILVGGWEWRFLAIVGLLWWVCWRCFLLYRLAAVVVCFYGVWMVFDSLTAGIGLWTAVWLIVTLFATALVGREWKQLRPGF